MDLATLATVAVTALTPYVKDAVGEFAGAAGEIALSKAKALLQKLKDKFKGDAFREGTLERFEKDPEKYAGAVEDVIVEAAQDDHAFADEVGKLVEEIEAAGPALKVVQRMRQARDVVGIEADEFTGGTAEVEQHADDAQGMTGMRVGRIGAGKPTESNPTRPKPTKP